MQFDYVRHAGYFFLRLVCEIARGLTYTLGLSRGCLS